jgi:hypothetical protein
LLAIIAAAALAATEVSIDGAAATLGFFLLAEALELD